MRLTSTLLLAIGMEGAQAAKCPFGYGSDKKDENLAQEKIWDGSDYKKIEYLSEIWHHHCPVEPVSKTYELTYYDYRAIVQQVWNHLSTFEHTPYFDQAKFAGCLVRAVGHDAMDFRPQTLEKGGHLGGVNFCINFDEIDNKGIDTCMQDTKLEVVYRDWCHKVSKSDLFVIAAEAVIAKRSELHDYDNPFGEHTLIYKFMTGWKYGRADATSCPAMGLMPDAEKGCHDVYRVLVKGVYWQLDEKSAWYASSTIQATHALGGAKDYNSGYEGNWVSAEHHGYLNQYYHKEMLMLGWGPQRAMKGNCHKNQWQRWDKDWGKSDQMMLDSDMCLAYTNYVSFKDCLVDYHGRTGKCIQKVRHAFLDVKREMCCAWLTKSSAHKYGLTKDGYKNNYCGVNIPGPQEDGDYAYGNHGREWCCAADQGPEDCGSAETPKGPAFHHNVRLATDHHFFFAHFAHSWAYMVNNVHQSVQLHELKHEYSYEQCDSNHYGPAQYGYSSAYDGEM